MTRPNLAISRRASTARRLFVSRELYGSLKSPECSCVSITLPADRKRESQHHVNGCETLRS
jgi:hypothetical protein